MRGDAVRFLRGTESAAALIADRNGQERSWRERQLIRLSRPDNFQGCVGQVAEWLKAPVSKTGVPATVSRVRISPCPFLCPVARCPRAFFSSTSSQPMLGRVAEWFKAHAWKACVRESVPRVRISLRPSKWIQGNELHPSALVICAGTRGHCAFFVPLETSLKLLNRKPGGIGWLSKCVSAT